MSLERFMNRNKSLSTVIITYFDPTLKQKLLRFKKQIKHNERTVLLIK
jgi:hypothetical protein